MLLSNQGRINEGWSVPCLDMAQVAAHVAVQQGDACMLGLGIILSMHKWQFQLHIVDGVQVLGRVLPGWGNLRGGCHPVAQQNPQLLLFALNFLRSRGIFGTVPGR